MSAQGDFGYTDADGNYTGGWSGSEASKDRAVQAERSGRAMDTRVRVWDAVRLSGLNGITWVEVAQSLGMHHGQASGALSNLHKAGKIERLTDRRGRCSIYVLPHAVNGRTVAPHGRVRDSSTEAGPDVQVAIEAARVDAYNEGHAAGYLIGHSDGVDSGRDEGEKQGWQDGYDAGLQIAIPEERLLDEARREGYDDGARRTKERATRVLLEMQRVSSQGHGLGGHTDKCWMIHPGCAFRVAVKAVASA